MCSSWNRAMQAAKAGDGDWKILNLLHSLLTRVYANWQARAAGTIISIHHDPIIIVARNFVSARYWLQRVSHVCPVWSGHVTRIFWQTLAGSSGHVRGTGGTGTGGTGTGGHGDTQNRRHGHGGTGTGTLKIEGTQITRLGKLLLRHIEKTEQPW